MKTSILKPGLLVSLKTSLSGGISYQKTTTESDRVTETGARRAAWETVRTISIPEEYELATVARGKARSLISAPCAKSNFGLLCPQSREDDLDAAIAAAKKIANAHNATAAATTVSVYVIVGRIAQDDAEAVRSISNEMRELLEMMQRGIATVDPEMIREAASQAKSIAQMLSPSTAANVAAAITESRAIAREMVRRIEKSGERAADMANTYRARAVDEARFSFLDLDTPEPTTDTEPDAPAARGLDFDAADETERSPMYAAPKSNNFALEF